MFRGRGGGLPLIDVWTEHQIRTYDAGLNNDPQGAETDLHVLAGYGLSNWPSSQGSLYLAGEPAVDAEYSTTWRYHKTVFEQLRALYGRNKWFSLIEGLRDKEEDYVYVTFFHNGAVAGEQYCGWGIFVRNLKPNVAVALNTSSALDDPRSLGIILQKNGLEGAARGITDMEGSLLIVNPAGSWAPNNQAWSLESGDTMTSIRTTSSPYVPWEKSRRVWGTTYNGILKVSLVKAADIYSYKASDIGHEGWAESAGRDPLVGTYSTLEALLPWMKASLPQQAPLSLEATTEGKPTWMHIYRGVDIPTPEQDWAQGRYGNPTILLLQRKFVGHGNPFKAGDEPDQVGNVLFPMGFSDADFRHMDLADGVALSDLVDPVILNRLYDVEITFEDVTWPSQLVEDDAPNPTLKYYPTLPRKLSR